MGIAGIVGGIRGRAPVAEHTTRPGDRLRIHLGSDEKSSQEFLSEVLVGGQTSSQRRSDQPTKYRLNAHPSSELVCLVDGELSGGVCFQPVVRNDLPAHD